LTPLRKKGRRKNGEKGQGLKDSPRRRKTTGINEGTEKPVLGRIMKRPTELGDWKGKGGRRRPSQAYYRQVGRTYLFYVGGKECAHIVCRQMEKA